VIQKFYIEASLSRGGTIAMINSEWQGKHWANLEVGNEPHDCKIIMSIMNSRLDNYSVISKPCNMYA